MQKEQAIRKVKKLLCLAAGGNTPEAQTAAYKAARLMQKFDISNVETSGHETTIVESTVPGSTKKLRMKWERQLALSVAEAFDTQVVHGGTNYGWCFRFIGYPDDVELCTDIFKLVRTRIQAACTIYREKCKKNKVPRDCKNFLLGAAQGAEIVLLKFKRKIDPDGASTDIILYKKENIQKYMQENIPGVRTRALSISTGQVQAYINGLTEGIKIPFRQSLKRRYEDTTRKYALM